MRIRSIAAPALLALLLLFAWPADLPAQDATYGDGAPMERRAASSNMSYLLAAFLLVWGCLWAYLAALHSGQRRLEKTIARLEGESR